MMGGLDLNAENIKAACFVSSLGGNMNLLAERQMSGLANSRTSPLVSTESTPFDLTLIC